MELKWLEDFVSVAEKGHFARAAEIRNITQSALSRRIKSLEIWVGSELLDRSQHPILLTTAGHEFIVYAREIIANAYAGRAFVSDLSKTGQDNLSIACLHTLSLSYVPNLVKKLHNKIPSLKTSIIAETRTIDEYLYSLFNGTCDFFVCYSHESISLDVDKVKFPHLDICHHKISAFVNLDHPDINFELDRNIPFVGYSANTYMSRVVELMLRKASFKNRLDMVYRASLAESVLTATQEGLGFSWLPELVIDGQPQDNNLRQVASSFTTELKVRIYRAENSTNPLMPQLWELLRRESIDP